MPFASTQIEDTVIARRAVAALLAYAALYAASAVNTADPPAWIAFISIPKPSQGNPIPRLSVGTFEKDLHDADQHCILHEYPVPVSHISSPPPNSRPVFPRFQYQCLEGAKLNREIGCPAAWKETP